MKAYVISNLAAYKTYYSITKPGIIRGNLISLAAGFFLASQGYVNIGLFAAVVIGTSLIIASGSVFNNVLDRKIDRKMDRTKNRAIASGIVSVKPALIYASLLFLLGSLALAFFVNKAALFVGIFGLFAYVVLYGIGKRKTVQGTLIGSISGATPPVAGYVAVTGNFDTAATIIFFILVFWQMPHFYAIAMFRAKDYKRAGLPVLPVIKGMQNAKAQILIYIFGFTLVASLLTVYGYTGSIYLIVCIFLGFGWLIYGLRGLKKYSDEKWAHKMFGVSLMVLLVLCLAISIDSFLP